MAGAAILTRAQMTRPRTPAGLFGWVEAKSRRLGSTRTAKAYARSNVLAKKFYEEIRPMALYALRRYGSRSDVRITPNLTNDNFDAVVAVPGEAPAYLEITYAKDYDDALRLEVLAKEGSVNALTPRKIVREKGAKRQVSFPNEAVEHADVVQNHLSLVEARLEGKANKSYGRRHCLIVVVDDYISIRTSQDTKALERVVTKKIRSQSLDFREIVAVGASGALFLPYSVDALRSNGRSQGTRRKRRAPEPRG